MNRKTGNTRVNTKNNGKTEVNVNKRKFRENNRKRNNRQDRANNNNQNNQKNQKKQKQRSKADQKIIRALKLGLLKKQNELADLRKQLNNIPSNFMDMRKNIQDQIKKVEADISRIKKQLKNYGL